MQHPVVGFSFILITCLQENVLLIIPGTIRRSHSSGKKNLIAIWVRPRLLVLPGNLLKKTWFRNSASFFGGKVVNVCLETENEINKMQSIWNRGYTVLKKIYSNSYQSLLSVPLMMQIISRRIPQMHAAAFNQVMFLSYPKQGRNKRPENCYNGKVRKVFSFS